MARLKADLRNAEFDLLETKVVAPTDGYVTQLFHQPGMTASPSRPTMVFIHSGDKLLGASFPQHALQRVHQGDEAQMALDAVPGRVFTGRVHVMADVIAQGQGHKEGNSVLQ